MSVAEVPASRPPVVEVHLDTTRSRRCAPRHFRWFQDPGSADVVALMKHAAVSDARLRRVTLPASAPELLVNLGEGRATDLALLEKSIIERVKRIRGIELEPAVRWVGRV